MKKNIKNSARAEGGLALNVSMCVNIRHSCFLILIIYIFQFQFFYTFYFFTCFKLALSSRPLCILHRGYLYVSKRTGEAKLKNKNKSKSPKTAWKKVRKEVGSCNATMVATGHKSHRFMFRVQSTTNIYSHNLCSLLKLQVLDYKSVPIPLCLGTTNKCITYAF